MSADLAVVPALSASAGVRVKAPYGMPRRGSLVHHVRSAAAFLEDGRLRYEVEWNCPGRSIDAILLASADERDLCFHCSAPREPIVYRCYDAAGQLLYVGHTGSWKIRERAHEGTSPWWHEVAETRTEGLGSISEARRAEARAIRAEKPRYNRLLTGSRSRRQAVRSGGLTLDARRLRWHRVAAGLSQRDLARSLECSESYISKLGAGRSRVSPQLLERLMTVLGCEIRDLMPDEPNGTAA